MKTQKKQNSIWQRRTGRVVSAFAVAAVVAMAGLYFAFSGSATSLFIPAEPDLGMNTYSAELVKDSTASGGWAVAFKNSTAPAPSPIPRPNPPDVIKWVTICYTHKTSPDDPIVFPGKENSSHLHTFAANTAVNPSSTAWQLFKNPTNCTDTFDKSSYWVPTLINSANQPVLPKEWRIYYRGKDVQHTKVQPMPFGLKMLAGDPNATTTQFTHENGFFCIRASDGAVVSSSPTTVNCGGTNFLRGFIQFPNCWDGINLDSPNHRTHVAYARNGVCPATHPITMPQMFTEFSYAPGATTANMRFEGGLSPYGLHGDFINAWDPGEMKMLTEQCIVKGRDCNEVTDRNRPFTGAPAELRGTLPIPAEP